MRACAHQNSRHTRAHVHDVGCRLIHAKEGVAQVCMRSWSARRSTACQQQLSSSAWHLSGAQRLGPTALLVAPKQMRLPRLRAWGQQRWQLRRRPPWPFAAPCIGHVLSALRALSAGIPGTPGTPPALLGSPDEAARQRVSERRQLDNQLADRGVLVGVCRVGVDAVEVSPGGGAGLGGPTLGQQLSHMRLSDAIPGVGLQAAELSPGALSTRQGLGRAARLGSGEELACRGLDLAQTGLERVNLRLPLRAAAVA